MLDITVKLYEPLLRDLLILSALIACWYWLRRPRRQRVGWVDLKAYYKTAHWQEVRRLKYKQAGGRCEKCNSRKKLETHHIHYRSLHKEKLSDLQLLCSRCHTRGSGKK